MTAGGERGLIAFLAPVYPALTETFVQREVEGLRGLGWTVEVVSLHPLGGRPRAPAAVTGPDWTLLGAGWPATLLRGARELAAHPLRSLRTLARALADALHPGEPLSLPRRLALLGQGFLGLAVASAVRPLGARIVHCQFANATTGVGMYAAGQLGIPFSFVGHANDLFDRRSLLRRKLERAVFVSCISEWHRAWYRELHDDRGERYTVVRCGVDLAEWRAREAPRAPDGTLRVLAVARLIPKKGIDVLIRALAELGRRDGTPWRLTLAGDGPERPRLEALAAELGCAAHVSFEGAVPNERVHELIGQADLVALPCRRDRLGDHDGIPVVLMEALACAVPPVVGDLPAIRELVRDGETGLTVPLEDVAGWVEALRRMAASPEERRRLGHAGRARVEMEFSAERNLARLDERLRAALDLA